MQWKGVSDLVTSIFGEGGSGSLLTQSIVTSMIIAACVGLVMELIRTFSKGKFPLSPLAIGLGVVVPPDSTIAMAAGAGLLLAHAPPLRRRKDSAVNKVFVDSHEPVCRRASSPARRLVGIGDALVKAFLL
jgi:uncharacterized oligopeptide transporter (OPT) family protein